MKNYCANTDTVSVVLSIFVVRFMVVMLDNPGPRYVSTYWKGWPPFVIVTFGFVLRSKPVHDCDCPSIDPVTEVLFGEIVEPLIVRLEPLTEY